MLGSSVLAMCKLLDIPQSFPDTNDAGVCLTDDIGVFLMYEVGLEVLRGWVLH